MSRSTLNVARDQGEPTLEPEQKLTEAISRLNKHAANVDIAVYDEQNVSQYICDLLAELSSIASKANLVFLTYLIDVAHEEARIQAQSRQQSRA
ncbi:hypothetical protein [Dichotomicrobium thermohalophilum]|uniref:Uncharacterized protein n=1 Tax=Dichotomicrobium thermohalophilum TaxID=933063 RepID=A0A397PPS4_9HYPH|nr:hypothetical protein [Dichotomicrobium thermohalophilum]RIA47761.1 hypothetical protein BXY53_2328 [Dichotomicrobium thermohalophilum]